MHQQHRSQRQRRLLRHCHISGQPTIGSLVRHRAVEVLRLGQCGVWSERLAYERRSLSVTVLQCPLRKESAMPDLAKGSDFVNHRMLIWSSFIYLFIIYYGLPPRTTSPPPTTSAPSRYVWSPQEWISRCSVTCGVGYEMRRVKCVDRRTGISKKVSHCNASSKPSERRECIARPCDLQHG